MSARGTLGRKSVFLIAANWAASALGFLASVLLARRLGPEAVGALGYGFGLIGVLAAVLLPGFLQAHVKRVAERRDLGQCVAAMGAIQLVLQVALVLMVLAATRWWPGLVPPGIPTAVVLLLLAFQVFSNLASAFGSAVLARQWAIAYGGLMLAGRTLRFAATVAVVLWAPDVRWAAATYTLEGFTALVGGFYVVCVLHGARLRRPDWETFRSYWVYARPLLVTSPIGLLQDSLDRVLVARWAGLSSAGYYQVARGLWEVLGTLNAYPFQLLFARLTELFARHTPDGDREARRLFASAVDKLLFVVVPVAFGVWILREPIIDCLYGPAFLPATGPLLLFVLTALAQAAINPYQFILYALEEHGRFVPVVLVRLAVYLGAMAMAVPLWGGIGAAAVRLLLVLFPAWVYVRWTFEVAGIGFERVTWVYVGGFVVLAGVGESVHAALVEAGVPAVIGLPAGMAAGLLAYGAWLHMTHRGAHANLRYAWDLARQGRSSGFLKDS